MMKKLSDMNRALPGLLGGMVLFGVVSQIVGMFFVEEKLNYSIGLWIGVLIAAFMAFHMAWSLNSALDQDVKGAQAVATRQNIIRYISAVGKDASLCLVPYMAT